MIFLLHPQTHSLSAFFVNMRYLKIALNTIDAFGVICFGDSYYGECLYVMFKYLAYFERISEKLN